MSASDLARKGAFLQTEISDRQVTHLIGLAQGLISDNVLDDAEVHFLRKWLVANDAVHANPLIAGLLTRIEEILSDGIIDDEERTELMDTLTRLTAADFELGEVLKSTTLPICDPAPQITFNDQRFCFTGTFTFGRRKECETAVIDRGASAGTLTQKTAFLVIGEYATESWKQESFGRKIEKAVAMRDKGIPISIVSEAHWRGFL